ncbi:MAG: molybdenum ABC transporter ATP-binding protein, partial [Betaproteobacteria bacterium]|nr:molybdenum ABC transporter ATP-binding protein [Betaproteobacteria bacterium]
MSTLQVDLHAQRASLAVQARFELRAGVITALIGRSGAGKTTVLHALAGLLAPSAGRIAWSDQVLFDAAARVNVPAHRRELGVVFQEGRLFPHLSVQGNLLYGARRSRRADGPQFDDVVQLLGIAPLLARRPHTLSGGERQRVAIGRALLSRPRALLMDEPLASLDPMRRHELLGYLAELPRRFGLPVLYVTHQMDEVLRLAERVVLMSDGRTVAQGDALEVLSDLSLQPLVGRYEAGSVLRGTLVEQLHEWQLSRVMVAGQAVHVPLIDAAPGAQVWLRVRARDVALARELVPSSASNQLHGTVLQVVERDAAYAAVELALSA